MAMQVVQTLNGKVSGIPGNSSGITVFKGIPYAAPPVGENRWKAPQPVQNWEGVYKAHEYKSGCPQPDLGEAFYRNCSRPQEGFNEDCLYLNLWTPAEHSDEKLPVFIWIHGGANLAGWGHFDFVDGEGFAKRGVIFVSFNWRVNVFGWLTHPELDKENPWNVSGNYAVLDQIAALKWVRDNIENFGGDKDNITICGESAGGSSVQNLCNTPLTKGMFKRAIMQSGGGWDLFASNSVPTLKASEGVTDLKRLFGVETIAEAREIPADKLVELSTRPEALGAYVPMHVVDGHVFLKTNKETCLQGEFHDVDYIIGHTGEETYMYEYPEDKQLFIDGVKAEYGDLADDYLALCEFLNDESEFKQHLRVRNAELLKTGAIAFAETLESYGHPVYMYCFSRKLPGDDMGSFHSCELWYEFETLNKSWRPFEAKDYELAAAMADYWCNFVKTGDPNDGQLPVWNKYTSKNPEMLNLDFDLCMKNFGENPRVTFRKKIICK